MPRSFNVPPFYRSNTIATIKALRATLDPKKKDFTPSLLNFGPLRFKIARHFGFCFGVENAIEIAYRAIEENPGSRIFLLSEMIHNPQVNTDLAERGVRFLMNTDGSALIEFEELRSDDTVIVPAFGTTVELQQALNDRGIDPYFYDTTCPFVEKVWKRSADLGRTGFTVVVHGKRTHEETRATFSHSKENSPTIIVLDKQEALTLCAFIKGEISSIQLKTSLGAGMSEGFDPDQDLKRIGVVNQTTMLASETKEIASLIKTTIAEVYGQESLNQHFADTRDTLCYATNENQSATQALIDSGADIALIVGGYNSSNTSHLVELCQKTIPSYYIKHCSEILSAAEIRHFQPEQKKVISTKHWIPEIIEPLTIALTSGASCPDRTVEEVMTKIVKLFPAASPIEAVIEDFKQNLSQTIISKNTPLSP